MKGLAYALTIVGLLLFSMPGLAQQEESKGSGLAILADSSYSGYKEEGGMGGPTSIGAELELNNQKQEPYFRIPIRVFKPWFDFKKEVNENLGIQFGLNYTFTFIGASSGITESSATSAGSGVFDIPVSWTLVGKESGNTGTLFFKLENRHVYSDVAPMFLGFQTGSILLPATKFNEFTFRFTEFYWQQALFDKSFQFVLGKLDPTNYFTFYGLIHPFMHFTGYGFSVSPSVNWPNQAWGTIVSYMFTPNIYAMGGLLDVTGDLFADGDVLNGGDYFFKGKLFKTIEVGYVPSFEERYFKKVSVLYWHSDEVVESSMGQGVALASHWFIKEKYIPFFLAGFSNGGGANTLAEATVSLGNGFRFKTHDILAIGLNWTHPAGGLRDQYTAEVFYRFMLTEHLAFTPDLQLVLNPSLNPEKDFLAYFVIRGRMTL